MLGDLQSALALVEERKQAVGPELAVAERIALAADVARGSHERQSGSIATIAWASACKPESDGGPCAASAVLAVAGTPIQHARVS